MEESKESFLLKESRMLRSHAQFSEWTEVHLFGDLLKVPPPPSDRARARLSPWSSAVSPAPLSFSTREGLCYFPKPSNQPTNTCWLLVVRDNSGNMNVSPAVHLPFIYCHQQATFYLVSKAAFPSSREVHFAVQSQVLQIKGLGVKNPPFHKWFIFRWWDF